MPPPRKVRALPAPGVRSQESGVIVAAAPVADASAPTRTSATPETAYYLFLTRAAAPESARVKVLSDAQLDRVASILRRARRAAERLMRRESGHRGEDPS